MVLLFFTLDLDKVFKRQHPSPPQPLSFGFTKPKLNARVGAVFCFISVLCNGF